MNPDTRTQIAALVGLVAILVKIIFKIEVPPVVQENIVGIVGSVVLVVLYLLRASNKKIEAKVDALTPK